MAVDFSCFFFAYQKFKGVLGGFPCGSRFGEGNKKAGWQSIFFTKTHCFGGSLKGEAQEKDR